jgi:hypothetical protein
LLPGGSVPDNGHQKGGKQRQGRNHEGDLLFSRHVSASAFFSRSIAATGIGSTP